MSEVFALAPADRPPEEMTDAELANAIEATVKGINDRCGRQERLLRATLVFLNRRTWTRAAADEWTRLTGSPDASAEELVRLIRNELGER